MMRSANDNDHPYDLEAHHGSTLPTDTDGDEDDAPSYISTSYFGGAAAGDESTVGAMTTDSDLIRGASVFAARLGQQQLYGNDNEDPPSSGRILVGKDYSLYDLNMGHDDDDDSANFEMVDLEGPDNNNKAAATTTTDKQPEQPQEEAASVVKMERRWGRLELALLAAIVFLLLFLAIFLFVTRFL